MWSAGGDVGYDAPTSYAYVQGEMCCEMLKHSTQHPIHVYFPDHLRLSSLCVPLLHASLINLKDTSLFLSIVLHEGVVWKQF
jgi:hypothetical protein